MSNTSLAADEKAALKCLDEVTKKWEPLYPHAMNRWHDNWDVITPISKPFSSYEGSLPGYL